MDLQRYLARMAGYCLTGLVREKALFFLHGPNDSGKSTFVNVLQGIMGSDYAVTTRMETFLDSKNNLHPTGEARLAGARLAVASETKSDRKWSTDVVKRLTGGDMISARFMGGDFFDFRPTFKILIHGNNAPEIGDVDGALRERFHIIPFNNTVPREVRDRNLDEKLKAEYPGILRWMVNGSVEYVKAKGLHPPACVVEATEEYMDEQDMIGLWIEQCCELDPDVATEISDLWKKWCEWCEETDNDKGGRKSFSQRLYRREGLDRAREAVAKRPRCVLGITAFGTRRITLYTLDR